MQLWQTFKSDPQRSHDSNRPGDPLSLYSVPHFQQCRVTAIACQLNRSAFHFPVPSVPVFFSRRCDYFAVMKIVVLDGFTLNPGDLSWDSLKTLGHCAIHDRTPSSEVVTRANGAEIVLTNKVVLNAEHLNALPDLKYIGILATGTNVVDVPAARSRGIVVTNIPAYGTQSVAQTTMALLLELTQRAGHHSHAVHEGRWSAGTDWCFWDYPLIELSDLTFGIIGAGRIGLAVGELAHGFGMKVLAYNPRPRPMPSFIKSVELKHLLQESDVVSLHCPLTPENQKLMNSERLGWMKPSAFLLNTSRGGLVDESALADALNTGRLAGAGLDVLSTEPPPLSNPLLKAKNCVITPHLAWGTRAARNRLMKIATENIRAFLNGRPQNVVN
jgi:glycerate dehydrogenase